MAPKVPGVRLALVAALARRDAVPRDVGTTQRLRHHVIPGRQTVEDDLAAVVTVGGVFLRLREAPAHLLLHDALGGSLRSPWDPVGAEAVHGETLRRLDDALDALLGALRALPPHRG